MASTPAVAVALPTEFQSLVVAPYVVPNIGLERMPVDKRPPTYGTLAMLLTASVAARPMDSPALCTTFVTLCTALEMVFTTLLQNPQENLPVGSV